ncbi:MAG TPA: glycoside hydrolase family 11 protein [Polyangiaceae bacterium]|nr:glycoside hydrolase family 11 protein [Polyangiaceae bacterium]
MSAHSNPFRFALLTSVAGVLLAGCAVDLTPEGVGGPDVDAPTQPAADAGGSDAEPVTTTSNQQGTNNDFFFTYWKDGGWVTMTQPSQPLASDDGAGHYGVSWTSGTYNFVGGKGWDVGSSNRTIHYDCGSWATGNSNAYLTVYGWTTEPLVEYYIVDSWGSWRPPGGEAAGQVTTDGGTYDLYRMTRVNAPNITGVNQDFEQYWSVRTTKRAAPTGDVQVTFANHESAWAAQGWSLGAHDYQVLATEVFNPASTGASSCTIW